MDVLFHPVRGGLAEQLSTTAKQWQIHPDILQIIPFQNQPTEEMTTVAYKS